MVTIKTEKINIISQNIYDSYVENINIFAITCTCGCKGAMKKYGHYTRSVRFKGCKITLCIQRIRCSVCGRTHSILLSVIVPYSQIPLADQIQIVLHRSSREMIEKILGGNYLIDDSEVYRILRNYDSYWLNRLIAAGVDMLSEHITERCIELYGRQFMQIHLGKTSLIYPST